MKTSSIIALSLSLSFLVRLIMALFFFSDAGDTNVYKLFAENIYRGCGLSYSDPNSIVCDLTSGGYFPGYPAFISIIWHIFGMQDSWILVIQIIVHTIALFLLLRAVSILTSSKKTLLAIGIIMAISPIQFGWYRFLITEPLAISFAMCFLSELIISIAKKEIRIIPMAIVMSLSVFVRPDTILMFVSLIPACFYIYKPKKAILKLFLVTFLCSIPISGWMIRNISIGDPLISIKVDHSPDAPGYIKWWKTWVTNEYQRADIFFPLWPNCNFCYSKIKIHNSKYIDENERVKASQLIHELRKFEGKPFPKEIDKQFHNLYIQKLNDQSFYEKVSIGFERAFYLILNPYSSWGLPIEITEVNKNEFSNAIRNGNTSSVYETLKENAIAVLGKLIVFIYRVIFFLCAVWILYRLLTTKNAVERTYSEINILMVASLLYFLTRLIFFIFFVGLESRFLIEAIIFLEVSIAVWMINHQLIKSRI